LSKKLSKRKTLSLLYPASQLRAITLLNSDYKLLTKVFEARLMEVLPTILHKSQLCSV
jgi:hypothetical protein